MTIRILIAWTLIVIGLGGYTRLMDAGLGCPDWPGCYGHWIMPQHDLLSLDISIKGYLEAWIEMIHRYAAGLLGIGVIIQALYLILKKRSCYLGIGLIITIIFQALLGMWTVTLKLHPLVVSSHFMGGVLLLSLLTLCEAQRVAARSSHAYRGTCHKLYYALLFVIALYALQLGLGAWVSTNYAGLSCSSLWSCKEAGSIQNVSHMLNNTMNIASADIPLSLYSPKDKAWIQVIHRLNAICLGLALFRARILSSLQEEGLFTSGLDLSLVFYTLQVGIGMILIIFQLPLWAASLHNIMAAFLGIPIIFTTGLMYFKDRRS